MEIGPGAVCFARYAYETHRSDFDNLPAPPELVFSGRFNLTFRQYDL